MASLQASLLGVVPFSFSFSRHPCRRMQRIVHCSASSGALSGSPADSWETLISQQDSSKPENQRLRKRLQIAGVDQEELVDPWLLADPDSRFAELHGVQIHYKIAHPIEGEEEGKKSKGSEISSVSPSPSPSPSPIPAILLHGFGASLFSWERVLRPLAQLLGSRVVAFDRPAFGLTSRIRIPLAQSASSNGDLVPVPLNPYSVGFSSTTTIAFIDFLQSNKAVLIGHSAGCIVAADAYLKAPERIAAIVLVAPALMAPLLLHNKSQTKQQQYLFLHVLLKVWQKIAWTFSKIGAMFQVIAAFIRSLWCRLLAATLRSNFGHSLIRIIMDRLSLQAVRLAWYDKERVDDYVIAGYTKPLKCRDWEHALLEYVVALVGDPSNDSSEVPLGKRLGEIQCPVLVITGDSDAIVPPWNAERLGKVLPHAHCHVIKNCGHLPHEEKPEEFLTIIQQFIQRVQHGTTTETSPAESVVFMPA